jgi:hypothetical protein
LLNLKQQDYPGAKRIEDWATLDLPILRWAKSQGEVVGFAHSGWGLHVSRRELPSLEMPGFDGIGANEYIVDVTSRRDLRPVLHRRPAAPDRILQMRSKAHRRPSPWFTNLRSEARFGGYTKVKMLLRRMEPD